MIKPLYIINYAKHALLLYESLPCQRRRAFKCLNFKIEKSEELAAYLPSFPSIPIPTSAYCIIPTSFPPSPIQAVTFFVYFLIQSVTYAFYVGEHLQHTTDRDLVAIEKNKDS